MSNFQQLLEVEVVLIALIKQVTRLIFLHPRLTRLSSSCRLIVSLSFKKKIVILAQLEAEIQCVKVQVV